MDFEQFVISGPSTVNTVIGGALANTVIAGPIANLRPVTNRGRCLTDTFSVTSPDGRAPSTICGTNSGEHSELSMCTLIN